MAVSHLVLLLSSIAFALAGPTAFTTTFRPFLRSRLPQLPGQKPQIRSSKMGMSADAVESMAHLLHHLPSSVDQLQLLLADASVSDAAEAVADADAGWFGGFDPKASFDTVWFKYLELIQRAIVSLDEMTGQFGFAIMLFTLGIRSILLPINYKQLESSARMQALNPEMNRLRSEYSDNPQIMNLKVGNLYLDEDVNPLAGCLPAVIQIPVLIGLYRSIQALAQSSRLDESFLWIPSLQGPNAMGGRGMGWLTENWVDNVPSLGWETTLSYLSIPLFLVVSQTIALKILQAGQPPPEDESAQRIQRILKFLPLMIGYFALNVPAALGVYWATNNVLTTAQSVGVRKLLETQGITPPTPADAAASKTVDLSLEEQVEEMLSKRAEYKAST